MIYNFKLDIRNKSVKGLLLLLGITTFECTNQNPVNGNDKPNQKTLFIETRDEDIGNIIGDFSKTLESKVYETKTSSSFYVDNTSQELIERFVNENNQFKYVLAVDKTSKKLYLFEDGKLNNKYPIKIALGPNSKDRKEKRDGRTPEGHYRIFWKKANDIFDKNQPKTKDYTNFTYFLGVNYPNEDDALHGLVSGFINRETYDDIIKKVKSGSTNYSTTLGGPIGIHTIPTGMDTTASATSNDWTEGCIAVDYSQMKVLYNTVPIGTPLIIVGIELKSP